MRKKTTADDEDCFRKIIKPLRKAEVEAEVVSLKDSLRRCEERFRLLVENVKDYAIFMLSPEGNVPTWNSGAERIKGYRSEEIIGKHFFVFYTAKDIRSRKPEHSLAVAAAEGRYEDEGWRVRKDGSRFWASVVITALSDDAGNVKGFSKITRDITERRKSEEAVRELTGHVLRAQDEERRRLGRELHDSTAQTLAAVSMNVAVLNELLDLSHNPKAAEALAELTKVTERASRDIRSIAYLLHPPMLEQAGLPAAVRWYVEGFAERTRIRVDLEIDSGLGRLSNDVELALFRVLQESLANVYRHSGSPIVRVRLALESGGIALEVSDEGKGFDLGKDRKGPVKIGVGISGMRERIGQLSGHFEVSSGTSGVTVKAVVPL